MNTKRDAIKAANPPDCAKKKRVKTFIRLIGGAAVVAALWLAGGVAVYFAA